MTRAPPRVVCLRERRNIGYGSFNPRCSDLRSEQRLLALERVDGVCNMDGFVQLDRF